MKKKNIKSLKLNKKTISIVKASQVKGGTAYYTLTGYIDTVGYVTGVAVDALIDYLDHDYY